MHDPDAPLPRWTRARRAQDVIEQTRRLGRSDAVFGLLWLVIGGLGFVAALGADAPVTLAPTLAVVAAMGAVLAMDGDRLRRAAAVRDTRQLDAALRRATTACVCLVCAGVAATVALAIQSWRGGPGGSEFVATLASAAVGLVGPPAAIALQHFWFLRAFPRAVDDAREAAVGQQLDRAARLGPLPPSESP